MDNTAKIATCIICTLAPVMRDCSRCSFRIGLAIKTLDVAKAQPSPAIREEFIAKVKKISNRNLIPA